MMSVHKFVMFKGEQASKAKQNYNTNIFPCTYYFFLSISTFLYLLHIHQLAIINRLPLSLSICCGFLWFCKLS